MPMPMGNVATKSLKEDVSPSTVWTYGWAPRTIHVCEAVTAVAFTAVGVFILAAALPAPWNALALVTGLAFLGWAVHRSFRLRLDIDSAAVRVVNYWRTYSLPWDEMVGIRRGFKMLGVVPLPAIEFRTERYVGAAQDRR